MKCWIEYQGPGGQVQKIEISDRMVIGSDSSCQLLFDDQELSPHHGLFKIQDDILSFTNLAGEQHSQIGDFKLGQGKMYLLDNGDVLQMGKLLIKIGIVFDDFEENDELLLDEGEYHQAIIDDAIEDLDSDLLELEDDDDIEDSIENIPQITPSNDESRLINSPQENTELKPTESLSVEATSLQANATESFGVNVSGLIRQAKNQPNKKEEKQEKTKKLKKGTFSFKSLFNKKANSGHKKSLPLAKKATYSNSRLPGPFLRLMAIFLGLILCFRLGNEWYILSVAKPLNPIALSPQFVANMVLKFQALFDMVGPGLISHKNIRPEFLYWPITYAIFEVLSHLIFAVSLPLLLLGVRSRGDFLKIRIQALFRILIGLATLPLLIFDLPLFMGKRSFKEWVTRSHLEKSHSLFTIFGMMVIYPVTIILCLVPNIIQDGPILLKKTIIKRVKAPELNKGESIANIGMVQKAGIHLRAAGTDKEKLILIPHYQRKKKQIITKYSLYTPYGNGTITPFKALSLKELFPHVALHDLAMRWTNPELFQFFMAPEVPIITWAESSELVSQTLGLDSQHLGEFALTRSPFLGSYLQSKAILFDWLQIKPPYHFKNWTIKQRPLWLYENNNLIVFYLSNEMQLNALQFSTATKQERDKKKWFNYLTSKVIPYSFPQLLDKEAINLNNLDMLMEEFLNGKAPMIPGPDLIKEAIIMGFDMLEQDSIAQEKFIRSLKGIDKILQFINKKQNNPEVKDLIYGLNRIQKAVKTKDINFFNQNLGHQ